MRTSTSTKFISILASTLLLASISLAKVDYKPGSYKIDPAHSKVGFEVTHLVINTVEGDFKTYDGTVDLGPKFTDSKVEANIDVNSIDTGNGDRDKHLKSPDFFDAAKFPKMTFKSSAITGTPESFKMTGDLTIKGVTKKVTFDGKFKGQAADGMGHLKSGFAATTKINRKDYGLNWSKAVEVGPVVGDEVTIDLKIEAGMPMETAKKK